MYKVPYHMCLLRPLIVNSTLDMNGSKADILQLIHHIISSVCINGLLSANKRSLSTIDTNLIINISIIFGITVYIAFLS